MSVNWDAVVGAALFLGGTALALGWRAAGAVAMLFGCLYIARALAAKGPQ